MYKNLHKGFILIKTNHPFFHLSTLNYYVELCVAESMKRERVGTIYKHNPITTNLTTVIKYLHSVQV